MSSPLTLGLPFIKMQGAGNDFVVLDALSTPLPDGFDFARAARVLCTRHFGVGSDGLLLLDQSTRASIRMRMWNPDGTEDMCGNGLRCIAQLAFTRDHIKQLEFNIETLAGIRSCEVLASNDVRVEMGEPRFEFEEIPFRPTDHFQQAANYSLPIGSRIIPHVTSLSTGSTHTVIFVDELPDDEEFFRLSPLIENHLWFPERTTVLWTRLEPENVARVRIWERGVGETLACGTGACAVGVAARIRGRGSDKIKVQSKGGELRIEWQKGETIWMTGPAKTVFEGTFDASQLR